MPTLLDIMAELDKPGRDPRKAISVMKFDDTVNTFDDLREGLVLNGIVTNITQFGVFVDIGIKETDLSTSPSCLTTMCRLRLTWWPCTSSCVCG